MALVSCVRFSLHICKLSSELWSTRGRGRVHREAQQEREEMHRREVRKRERLTVAVWRSATQNAHCSHHHKELKARFLVGDHRYHYLAVTTKI